MTFYESDIEDEAIKLLTKQGYAYLSPEEQQDERESLSAVVLRDRLQTAIDKLNPKPPPEAKDQALRSVLALPTPNLMESNQAFHQMLSDGVGVEYRKDGDTLGASLRLIDFEEPLANDLLVCNQFTVTENNTTKRLDIVLFINGLPLTVIELKNPSDEKATIHKAFMQLQNYKEAVPGLFAYNGVLVISDGIDARVGALSTEWQRFTAWKTIDGLREVKSTKPQLRTLVKGMLRPDILLDLIRHFSVFEKNPKKDPTSGLVSTDTVKKIAAYHQYHAVKKAVETTKQASRKNGSRKAGVVWHTQGSGKSLSMVFYVGKIVLELDNPTVVVVTDRNDLDDQLFDTFAAAKDLLRQEPTQARDRLHLKRLLKTAGGGIIFTTIQKFSPEDLNENFELLSERENIIVIADEAHRSQYGFGAKTLLKNKEAFTRYGFAKHLRDALPNASFLGFTGTPIEKEDASTRAVFGDYIDIYDVNQAVEDGATVSIYYESRLAKVHLKKEDRDKLDEEVEQLTENEEASAKAKAKWARLEAIVGHKERLQIVAQDILKHFDQRQEACEGKGMIVAMSRRIAVDLYNEIIKVRSDWHSTDAKKGVIKVIMTSNSSDPKNWQIHNTTKQERREIAERLKDPQDPLHLVIVRDMWLTGFDVPCLHTMYVDKPMRGHNLMQAIARVNRVYKNKPGGLIVDYIGIASDLRWALTEYAASGGQGAPTLNQSMAIDTMLEKYEVVARMFNAFDHRGYFKAASPSRRPLKSDAFDYKRYFQANTQEKMSILLEAQEYILSLGDGKNRFVNQVTALSKAFALSVPSPQAMKIKADIGFFQTVKARLTKFEAGGNGKSNVEIESAIRQIVDKAIVADKVIDIFDAAGMKKPDLSILSDEFLEEIRGMQHKNLAIELLRKILNDEIRTGRKKNLIQNKKLSKMLASVIRKYQKNLLSTSEIIDELIKIARTMKASAERGEIKGLNSDEIAFYDALSDNKSAKDVLGNENLRELAAKLVRQVRANVSIDWTVKESVRSRLEVIVKRTLRKYGYPPDKQKMAVQNILAQAGSFASQWSHSVQK